MFALLLVCLAEGMSGIQSEESLAKTVWNKVEGNPIFTRLNAVEDVVRDLEAKIKVMEKGLLESRSLQAELKSECEELNRLIYGGSNAVIGKEDEDRINHHDRNNSSYLNNNIMPNAQTLGRILDSNGAEVLKDSAHTPSSSEKRISRSVAGNVAFSAFLSHSIDHIALGQVIKCDRTVLNDGNAYNTATGMFTVPITGVYLLSMSVDSYAETHVTLMVNSARVADLICDATPQRTHMELMSSNTIVIQLYQGQSVWMEVTTVDNAQIIGNENWRYTTFSGLLMY
ncbi:hypothetical protein DPMN_151948 [Dreissena polymorpha]|uniref:C1q domain-containing protein n=1 Tax=Dreissena polymorpha TaxID=45954 RepID=A0A9D4J6Z4_DREPO|nr:hypothetical protein DPMN_151948 [Dreissena polymorpha]